MPTYTFRNKETGEMTEKFMSWSARDEYLRENPQLEATIGSAPPLIDPTRLMGVRRADTGFREVLQKIHERAPGSTLKDSIR